MVCTSAGPTSPPRTSRSSPAHLAGIPHPVRLDSWRTVRLRLSYRKNFIACVLEKKPFETDKISCNADARTNLMPRGEQSHDFEVGQKIKSRDPPRFGGVI